MTEIPEWAMEAAYAVGGVDGFANWRGTGDRMEAIARALVKAKEQGIAEERARNIEIIKDEFARAKRLGIFGEYDA